MGRYIFLLLAFLTGEMCSGQDIGIALAEFETDSQRISINRIIDNPVVSIHGIEDLNLISYELTLIIDSQAQTWYMRSPRLSPEQIKAIGEISDSGHNQVYVESVKYSVGNDTLRTKNKLFLWLSRDNECDGTSIGTIVYNPDGTFKKRKKK